MELIKETFRLGNSAGVILPRSWENRKVKVQLIEDSILNEVIEILKEKNLLEHTKGIYLIGSYARGDYDLSSDIDLLIITDNIDKLIRQGNYEIVLVSEKNFSENFSDNIYRLSALREAKVIINGELLKRLKIINKKIDLKKNLKEIRNIFAINKNAVKDCKDLGENVPDGIVYSLVLRLRELYIMKKLLSDDSINRKEFINLIGRKVYDAYLRVKRNKKELNYLTPKELAEPLNLTKKWLKELSGRRSQ